MYTVPLTVIYIPTTGVTNQGHDTGDTRNCRVWLFVLSNGSTEVYRTCQRTWILMVFCRLFFSVSKIFSNDKTVPTFPCVAVSLGVVASQDAKLRLTV